MKDQIMRNEIWKPYPRRPSVLVSNMGRIKTNRSTHYGYPRYDGHMVLTLRLQPNKNTTVRVHQMVMLTFVGPAKGLVVNHKNGIKSDNRLENLEYMTAVENLHHAYKIGLFKKRPKRKDLAK